MIHTQTISELITYFARFIPLDVRKEIFRQPAASRPPFYDELKADIMAVPSGMAFPEIDSFIVSINDKFVADRVRNSKRHLLFLEYGTIKITSPNTVVCNETALSLSVACALSETNADMITEALRMQRNLEIINIILQDMKRETDRCPVVKYINFPTDLTPLDPTLFFGHAGWSASFTRKHTVL